jgi:aminoglycoside phosphotransferase
VTALLAPDPAVPMRDALLDERGMAERFGADACERMNAKYRVGDSLRVVYRLDTAGTSHTLAGRTFAGRSASVYRRALARAAAPADGLPPVLHLPELETVFWTFPNDRRLAGLRLLADGSGELDRLVGRRVARTRLMAYAPERAATAACLDAGGRVLAYVKVHWDAAERELANLAAASAVSSADPRLRLPRVLGASLPDGALVLEPLAGHRLDGLAPAALAGALRSLGAALATLHGVRPLPARRFDRLDPERLALAVDVIGRARPDCRDAAGRLLARLGQCSSAGEPVHLHGDANLRNALLDDDRVCLVDLEDAGLLAAREGSDGLSAALLDGYAQVGRVPDEQALRWHTAASVLARIAVPAVGRIRPALLARLEPLLRAAGELVR